MNNHSIKIKETQHLTSLQTTVVHPSGQPLTQPPLTLYLHLPWCGSKCPYCDFNSHKAPTQLPETAYVEAILSDLEKTLPQVWGRSLQAIFIGGGTPSLFSAEAIDRLLIQIRTWFNPSAEIEITLEANPDSSDIKKFADFRAAGINRLSLGVQSFDDDSLRQIRRLHDANAAHRAAEVAVTIFDNVNIDLMYALPSQSEEQAIADVQTAISFSPTHLSLYQLTLEAKTPFFRHPPAHLPDSDKTADIGESVSQIAHQAGYQQYEISAYAKDKRQCQHNLNYWYFGDYLGVGAGAHAKITQADGIYREQRINNPKDYMNAPDVWRKNRLTAEEAVFEFLLNAFRLTDGFSMALLSERVGLLSPSVMRSFDRAETSGFIKRDDHHYMRPTDKGKKFLNDLLLLFLPSTR